MELSKQNKLQNSTNLGLFLIKFQVKSRGSTFTIKFNHISNKVSPVFLEAEISSGIFFWLLVMDRFYGRQCS